MIIRQAQTEANLTEVRRLCWAYRAALAEATKDRPEIVETFYAEAAYADLLSQFPAPHVPPDGGLFLAETSGDVVGCAMTRRLDATTCELKRLYVAPEARRLGVAQGLMEATMADARNLGYARYVFDTTKEFSAARAFYASMGIEETGPYYSAPAAVADTLVFFGTDL